MEKKYCVELDVAYDQDHDTITKNIAQECECEVKLLELVGPGGGNPLYLFTGTKENLQKLIVTHFDDGDTSFTFTLIEEVKA